MQALYYLIPLGIVVMIVLIIGFWYSVMSGQYNDLEGPAHRILFDDDDDLIPTEQQKNTNDHSMQSNHKDHQ